MYLSKVLKSGLVIGELEPTIKHVHLQGSAVVAKTSKFSSEDFHSQTAVNWALAENTKTVKYHVKYTSKSNTNKDKAPFFIVILTDCDCLESWIWLYFPSKSMQS